MIFLPIFCGLLFLHGALSCRSEHCLSCLISRSVLRIPSSHWDFEKCSNNNQEGRQGTSQRFWTWTQSKESLTTDFHAFTGELTETFLERALPAVCTILTENPYGVIHKALLLSHLIFSKTDVRIIFPTWQMRKLWLRVVGPQSSFVAGAGLEARSPDPEFCSNFWQQWKPGDMKKNCRNRMGRPLVWRRENTPETFIHSFNELIEYLVCAQLSG